MTAIRERLMCDDPVESPNSFLEATFGEPRCSSLTSAFATPLPRAFDTQGAPLRKGLAHARVLLPFRKELTSALESESGTVSTISKPNPESAASFFGWFVSSLMRRTPRS